MKKGYCECGCGEKTKIATQTHTESGWVRGEPKRYIHGHSGGSYRIHPEERFWDKVEKTDTCWLWKANTVHGGYGLFHIYQNKQAMAHRFSYELLVGKIPEGLTLDHLCRVRNCVNPDHLEPVTLKENIHRGSGVAGLNKRKTHCIRGHDFTEENTYRRRYGRECAVCKKMRYRPGFV